MNMWVLRSTKDAEGGPYTFRMTDARARTLGRGQGSNFVVDASLVSRSHCRLSVANGELVVENLGSTNGTFINDSRIEQGTLKAGDLLRAGSVEFSVSTE